ncbi:MAG: hypothetical protein ABR549_09215 [Mycobacteriales bacterium]
MLWVLLDVVIGVLSLTLVGLMAFLLYKRVRVLLRAVGAASSQVGERTSELVVRRPAGKP